MGVACNLAQRVFISPVFSHGYVVPRIVHLVQDTTRFSFTRLSWQYPFRNYLSLSSTHDAGAAGRNSAKVGAPGTL